MSSKGAVDAEAIAFAFQAQVDAFYALPRKRRPRDQIVFSPSGVSKCARELYYASINAPSDEVPLVPWRERMSRNGTALHDATQKDLFRMEHVLREAGVTPRFRLLAAEIDGEKSFSVNGRVVTLRGRCDGKLGVLDDEGNVIDEIGLEIKSKSRREQLTKVLRSGPQQEHIAQTVAYALLWGVRRWMFLYESMNKPKWSEVDSADQAYFLTTAEEAQERRLLVRLGAVVEAIEERRLPAPDLSLCGFCVFKAQCAKDGGYKG